MGQALKLDEVLVGLLAFGFHFEVPTVEYFGRFDFGEGAEGPGEVLPMEPGQLPFKVQPGLIGVGSGGGRGEAAEAGQALFDQGVDRNEEIAVHAVVIVDGRIQ